MTEPPKPPPVIRAPVAPAAMAGLYGRVGLGPGHLEVIAQGLVRRSQERAGLMQLPGPQQLGGLQYAAVLADDVPGAPSEDGIGKQAGCAGIGDVSQ